MRPTRLLALLCHLAALTVAASKEASPGYRIGCFFTNKYSRLLPHRVLENTDITPAFCKDKCIQLSYNYFGMRSGDKCYCGDVLVGGMRYQDTMCDLPCRGDARFTCGGKSALEVFHTHNKSREQPKQHGETEPASEGTDATTEPSTTTSTTTPSTTTSETTTTPRETDGETEPVSEGTDATTEPSTTSSTTTPSTTTSETTTTPRETDGETEPTSEGTDATTKPTASITGEFGCFSEDIISSGAFSVLLVQAGLTLEMCRTKCLGSSQSFPYFGVKAGTECSCGKQLDNAWKRPLGDCGIQCGGNSLETCGGKHSVGAFDVRSFTPVVGECYTANDDTRVLSTLALTSDAMTRAMCRDACRNGSYAYFGVSFGSKCFCGSDLIGGEDRHVFVDACDWLCLGHHHETCGSDMNLLVFRV